MSQPNRQSAGDDVSLVAAIRAGEENAMATLYDRFSQIVRNIKSHKDQPGNLLHEGLLIAVKGGFRITPAGQLHLKNSVPKRIEPCSRA